MAGNDALKNLAMRLRWAREQAGLSQGQVAQKMGLHRPTVSQIEAGQRNVRIDEFESFSQIYGVSREWLVSGDDVLPGVGDPRIQLAARELSRLKKDDLDTILRLIQALRDNEGGR